MEAGDLSLIVGLQRTGPTSARFGKRLRSIGSAIRASSRASEAPRQK